MLTISCQEMKAMDSYAIQNMEIPSIILMENAALKILKNIDFNNNSFTVICGVGNNGGDGLAVVRHLIMKDKHVDLFIIGSLDRATEDFNINLNILKHLGLKINNIKTKKNLSIFERSLEYNDLTIDSIFGIGLSRNIEGLYKEVIDLVNIQSKEILAVDIPSGLDGDNGSVLGVAVKARKTVTFHLIKKGLLDRVKYTGDIVVESIGIPEQATKAILKDRMI